MTTALKVAVALICAVLYAVYAHRVTLSGDTLLSSYAFVLVFPLLALAGIAIAHGRRYQIWLAALALCVLLPVAWFRLNWPSPDPSLVLLLQHAGVHAALGLLFARSLFTGRDALVTAMARVVHGDMPPDIERYTRQVTWAWTIYFGAMTAASVALYVSGQTYLWSVLANFLTMPLVIVLFIVEIVVRRRRLPHVKHTSIKRTIEAYASVRGRKT